MSAIVISSLSANMDFGTDADPMISSAIFPDYHIITSQPQQSHASFGVLDFDSYSRPTMLLDDSGNDVEMNLDSPVSVDTYNESEMELGFQDNHSVASPPCDERCESPSSTPQQRFTTVVDDDLFESDRRFVAQRFAPHDLFPADNNWTLEEKVDRLLELSPCDKYTKQDILNIDAIENADAKVDMLIDVVGKIPVNFRWNYVKPNELNKSYTVVTDCKKEKKKDADGQSSPKRPMNAFMIWSKKCRSLIALVSPQLHNAIISTKLGAAWRQFDDAEKAIYEREKEVLTSFHQHEFPNYKYKPRKKAKKSEEKPAPAPKPKSNKKRKTENSQPAPLRGINIADARQNLDPMLKERLQVKMQVKIDPDLKKGIGKRVTAIDLADLTAYHQNELPSPTLADAALHNSQSAVHLVIDSRASSVFDTPENSPHTPITPVTPTEQILNYGSTASTRSDKCFDFDDKSTIRYPVENNNNSTTNNNVVLTASALDNNNIKTEPNMQWNLNLSIKTEPQDHGFLAAHTNSIIKMEPDSELDDMPQMPVLSAEAVEAILDSGCTSNMAGFSSSEFFNDFMTYLDNDTDIGSFPTEPPSALQVCLPEGPATV